MHKARFLIPFIVAAVTLASGPARAGGWGPYFSWSYNKPDTGFPEWMVELAVEEAKGLAGFGPEQLESLRATLRGVELNFEQNHISFGVIYDSAPARDKLFNFRMTLGVDLAVDGKVSRFSFPSTEFPLIVDPFVERASSWAGSILDTTGYGGSMKFTFGFSPIRRELLKWWLGPCLRVSGNYYPADIPLIYEGTKLGSLKHGGSVAIGGGIETGLNVHVTSFMSLGLTFGFLWNAYGLAAGLEDDSGEVSSGAMVWGDGPMVLLQASALFRTGKDRDAWR